MSRSEKDILCDQINAMIDSIGGYKDYIMGNFTTPAQKQTARNIERLISRWESLDDAADRPVLDLTDTYGM
jgi:hypothetical protein